MDTFGLPNLFQGKMEFFSCFENKWSISQGFFHCSTKGGYKFGSTVHPTGWMLALARGQVEGLAGGILEAKKMVILLVVIGILGG